MELRAARRRRRRRGRGARRAQGRRVGRQAAARAARPQQGLAAAPRQHAAALRALLAVYVHLAAAQEPHCSGKHTTARNTSIVFCFCDKVIIFVFICLIDRWIYSEDALRSAWSSPELPPILEPGSRPRPLLDARGGC